MALYARTETEDAALASPCATGWCRQCGGPMVPHCGEIRIAHWAHKSMVECDSWSQGETEWHLWWKSRAPREWCEVTIEKRGVKHRADILRPSKQVIELQHSSIAPAMIREREKFYSNMVWIFDARAYAKNLTLWHSGPISTAEDHPISRVTFRWKWPRFRIVAAEQPLVLDLGPVALWVEKFWRRKGMGRLFSKEALLNRLGLTSLSPDEVQDHGVVLAMDLRDSRFGCDGCTVFSKVFPSVDDANLWAFRRPPLDTAFVLRAATGGLLPPPPLRSLEALGSEAEPTE